jgi:hypothetical protein
VWQRRRASGDSKPYLSPQQKKLLRRIAKGKTDEEIAKEFGCRADLIDAGRGVLVWSGITGKSEAVERQRTRRDIISKPRYPQMLIVA